MKIGRTTFSIERLADNFGEFAFDTGNARFDKLSISPCFVFSPSATAFPAIYADNPSIVGWATIIGVKGEFTTAITADSIRAYFSHEPKPLVAE